MRFFALPALIAALPFASAASANVVISYYNNSGNYHWKCYHMPDFDQRRDNCCGHPGLPNDGAMWCVPTSAMNLFAYAANHGYPWLDPGQANWQSQALYDVATSRLGQLGAMMSCSPTGGTGGTGWKVGAQFWLSIFGNGFLTCQHFYLTNSYTPRAYKMGKKATQGSIIEFVYGRYEVIGSINGVPVINRTGGHAVTLSHIWNFGNGTTIRYRDPADARNDAVQSTFVNKEVNAVAISVIFSGSFTPRTVTAIAYPSDDGKIRIIDGFMTLKPMWGLSFFNNDGLMLSKISPNALEGQGTAPVKLETGIAIADLCLDADGDDAIAIVNVSATTGFTALQRIDLNTGEQMALGGFNTLKRCCVARGGDIYAHDGDKLYHLSPEGDLMEATSSIPVPTALAYDDTNEDVLILSVPERKLTRLNSNLSMVSTFNVPTNVPMSGDGSVIVNPFDHKVYFCTDGSNSIYDVEGLVAPFTFDTVNVSPALMSPKGIGVSDDGKLFVSSQGFLKVLEHVTDRDRQSAWNYDTDSPFFNALVGGRLSMLTSRSNVDPAQHDTPAWNNIDPDLLLDIGVDVPDCLGDLNLDSKIDAADLALLLGAWNTAGGEADLNADGIVNATDLGIMLGLWGDCP